MYLLQSNLENLACLLTPLLICLIHMWTSDDTETDMWTACLLLKHAYKYINLNLKLFNFKSSA